MPVRSPISILPLALAVAPLPAQGAKAPKPKPAAVTFNGTEFHLRWSKAGQFEFTPAGQEDLNRWTEMLTIWRYDAIRDGDALAAQANRTLGAYQSARGKILRTNSLPRTAQKPAEHFIAVLLGGGQALEFAAASAPFLRQAREAGPGALGGPERGVPRTAADGLRPRSGAGGPAALRGGRGRGPYRRAFCSAMNRSTCFSSTGRGTEPLRSTASWKRRTSKRSPSSASARARRARSFR